MPLFGRGRDEVKQAGGADPGAALTDALERYRAMPVPERAALVLATVAPAIAEHWDAARVDPRQLMEPTLVKPLIPQTGVHKETPEQYRARLVDLPVILAEAFNALVFPEFRSFWALGRWFGVESALNGGSSLPDGR